MIRRLPKACIALTRPALALSLLLLALVLAPQVSAQNLQIEIPRGPHYAGESIDIRILATGFEEEPTPEIDFPAPQSGRLQFLSVSPSVQTSIQIVNGSFSRRKKVSFVYQYRFVADTPGRVELGPVTARQSGRSRTTPAVPLNISTISPSDEISVALRLPDTPVYVGQYLPIEVEFRMTRKVQEQIQGYTLNVPFFERRDNLVFIDGDEESETNITVATGSGTLEFPARVYEFDQDGEETLSFAISRTAVPLAAGTFSVSPATLVVERAVRWRRDLFGRRVATAVRKFHASDEARKLEVRPIPSRGRPPSFAGAVGEGFTLEVEADRTIVQVGEPIALEFSLRGAGSLEAASLPPLDAPGLLPPQQFRVPERELAGHIEDGSKTFRVTVRVLEVDVTEIPPLAYSWFDPKSGRFETSTSQPIALSVRPAQVVTASDVVSNPQPAAPAPEADATVPAAELPTGPPAQGRARMPEIAIGADLSIVREPRVLLGAGSHKQSPWAAAGIYALGLGLVALAAFDRRRRDVSPREIAKRRSLAAELQRVRETAAMPEREGAAQVADALRRMVALVPSARSEELDLILGDCDARSYAPSRPGEGAQLPGDLAERAARLAEAIVEAAQ